MTTLSSDPNKMYTISSQRNKKSGELDVFEAARYFSATNELQRATGRMSLDSVPPQMHSSNQQKQRNDHNKNKLKQPSSPGGRLASFLNALFNQTSSKKKKEENNSTRRKRRSSISHFRITTLTTNATDQQDDDQSNSKSGFRTPPPYANTPMKSYKEFRSLSDQTKAASMPRLQNKVKRMDLGCLDKLDEKFKVKNVSDGYDSDSSSDLFDLPNHDLDFFPTGLPVYETTDMDRIKIGPKPISRCSH